MKIQTLHPHPSIAAYVSSIVVLEHNNISRPAVLPLIAKGYPSIAFQVTGAARLSNAATGSRAAANAFSRKGSSRAWSW
jgi:hypothetical protein